MLGGVVRLIDVWLGQVEWLVVWSGVTRGVW